MKDQGASERKMKEEKKRSEIQYHGRWRVCNAMEKMKMKMQLFALSGPMRPPTRRYGKRAMALTVLGSRRGPCSPARPVGEGCPRDSHPFCEINRINQANHVNL